MVPGPGEALRQATLVRVSKLPRTAEALPCPNPPCAGGRLGLAIADSEMLSQRMVVDSCVSLFTETLSTLMVLVCVKRAAPEKPLCI